MDLTITDAALRRARAMAATPEAAARITLHAERTEVPAILPEIAEQQETAIPDAIPVSPASAERTCPAKPAAARR